MSINAVKGIEIGAGFNSVIQKGSEHRDEITHTRVCQQSCRRNFRWN